MISQVVSSRNHNASHQPLFVVVLAFDEIATSIAQPSTFGQATPFDEGRRLFDYLLVKVWLGVDHFAGAQ